MIDNKIKLTCSLFILLAVSFARTGYIINSHAEKTVKPPPVEAVATVKSAEIVTGVCTFGDCPVFRRTEMSLAKTTEAVKESLTTVNLAKQPQNLTTAKTAENKVIQAESAPETEATSQNEKTTLQEMVAENATTEPTTEPLTAEPENESAYIGRMYVTAYTAEEGFPEGSETASGYGVRPGYCAMNADQRRSLGISYGDQIYVEGLGTYTVMDCGCGWGVVDIWVYTNAEAYSITGSYNVYLV